MAGLLLVNNTLYGTTSGGGTNGDGTIFRIGVNGAGYNIVKSFGSFDGDGENPQADLTIQSNLLYGTTEFGGANTYGMVFSINTNGANFNDVYDFMGYPNDGANPRGGLCSP